MYGIAQTAEVHFGIQADSRIPHGSRGQFMNSRNQAESDSGKSSASLRVLLVDDDPRRLRVSCALLSSWGIHPVVARNGSEALELVRGRDFDIVLMDIAMPVMDGIVATQEIRRFEHENPSKARVPVVAYSSRAVTLSAKERRLIELSAVLKKPSDADSLSRCLSHWCGSKFSPKRVS
jgi:CheY-like chemotaxis protein